MLTTKRKRIKRHRRVRAKIKGAFNRPRLVVFRSNQHIYAQLIDDSKGHTLISASDSDLKSEKHTGKNRGIFAAEKVGELLAERAKKSNIQRVVFDRGGFSYHGRVKALADGARKGGLKF